MLPFRTFSILSPTCTLLAMLASAGPVPLCRRRRPSSNTWLANQHVVVHGDAIIVKNPRRARRPAICNGGRAGDIGELCLAETARPSSCWLSALRTDLQF
ncbi:hypothetical protein GGS23DRAFT_315373 [Durotheca rogersii]|uniref:uncharacterized protein n=1 Tax=Durotheca rogersii TaxID=419775 RepID=UPI0022206E8B|nr:uncharacterized protein GGS23DRAFT_315373 [Durotheca rogersii]KAI5859614.1 hypothetical protein GGS23DRAFT_315373 [Durotheca rogersii]